MLWKDIGKRDEIYPTGVSAGYPGYSYQEAVSMKQRQEDMMRDSSKTVEIIVNIEPIANRNNEYIVHNLSTYLRY